MNENLPPPNRAIGWYRFMLWVMPTCVAMTTAFGFVWISSKLRLNGNLMVLGWFVLNILATHGFAIFDAKLRNRPGRPVSLKTDDGWIRFLLLQLLIVPLLSLVLFFAVCVTGAF